MKVIDKLGIPLNTTFGELAIGEGFVDKDNDTNIKVGFDRAMYWLSDHWACHHVDVDTPIIPIEVTYTFERM